MLFYFFYKNSDYKETHIENVCKVKSKTNVQHFFHNLGISKIH